MATKKTRFSISGINHAVGIPREFHLNGDNIETQLRGDTQILLPQRLSWAPLLDSLKKFTGDFMAQSRQQPAIHKRKRLFA